MNKKVKTIKLSKAEIIPVLESMVKEVYEGLKESSLNEDYGRSEMSQFVSFALNYDHKFIDNAWKDDPNMANHLNSKFSSYYNQVGSYGAMIKFYSNLDEDNRKILENYILNRKKFGSIEI